MSDQKRTELPSLEKVMACASEPPPVTAKMNPRTNTLVVFADIEMLRDIARSVVSGTRSANVASAMGLGDYVALNCHNMGLAEKALRAWAVERDVRITIACDLCDKPPHRPCPVHQPTCGLIGDDKGGFRASPTRPPRDPDHDPHATIAALRADLARVTTERDNALAQLARIDGVATSKAGDP